MKKSFCVLSLVFSILLGVESLVFAAPECPAPGRYFTTGAYYGSCVYELNGADVCTDFTGWAWTRTAAHVRCMVAKGEFVKTPCSRVDQFGACWESINPIKSLAEVHRVYAPATDAQFEEICRGYHGVACEDRAEDDFEY